MAATLISMSVFALVGAITPGPVNIIATSVGATFGFVRTLPHVLGASVAYTLMVFLLGAGLNQLLQNTPQISETLKYVGSIFLLYMAWKIATARSENDNAGQRSRPPVFIQGALCQWLNPKAWLVSMSGVSVFVLAHNEPEERLIFFSLISFVLCFVGVATWAATGQFLRRFLQSARRQALFNRLMGILLSLVVASILFGA